MPAKKPLSADEQATLALFWERASYDRLPESMSLLQANPWILHERLPVTLPACEGMPFLHAAIFLGQRELAVYGVKHGAPLEDRCPKGNTALQALALSHPISYFGRPFNNTSEIHHRALIDRMIAAGARLDVVNALDHKPLWFQVSRFESLEMVEKYILGGSPLNFLDEHNTSGLAELIGRREMAMAALLLRHGADANLMHPEELQKSPLGCALNKQNFEMAELLVAHGADVHAKDHLGLGHVFYAYGPETVSWLSARGVDMQAQDNLGRTPLLRTLYRLHKAFIDNVKITQKNEEKIAIAMIAGGASVHAKPPEDGSITAGEIITAYQDRAPDLYNALLAINAREVAMQALSEMGLSTPSP